MNQPKGPAILMDPWFSPTGAFFGSWFQFPDNAHLVDQALRGVSDICVSHNHNDHLDPPLLRRACLANPSVLLHIPRYETKWFMKRLARLLPDLAARIIEHASYESFRIGPDASVCFVPEESPGAIDSAIVCTVAGRSLVNLNDSRLSADQLLQIREMTNGVDLVALQASGASEYPINYLYSPAQMRSRSLQKRRDKLDQCKEIIDLLEPRRVLFFAGPPVFLDSSLSQCNERSDASVFPDQLDILREIERDRPDIALKTLFLLPGEPLDDRYLWRATALDSPRLQPYTDKPGYLAAYAERRIGVFDFNWGEPPSPDVLLAYFTRMANISRYMSERIGGEISFVIKGQESEQTFTVDFAHRTVREGISSRPLYVLTAPASSVSKVIEGSATWDDVFLSLRMTFDERTDPFVAHFKPLLRFMDAELFLALERHERRLAGETETIDVTYGGETFRIQRRCPHAGTDLEYHGRVNDDGTITCLAHRFRFDLRSGECKNAWGYRLKVEPA